MEGALRPFSPQSATFEQIASLHPLAFTAEHNTPERPLPPHSFRPQHGVASSLLTHNGQFPYIPVHLQQVLITQFSCFVVPPEVGMKV